jgi:hypothetical protein
MPDSAGDFQRYSQTVAAFVRVDMICIVAKRKLARLAL